MKSKLILAICLSLTINYLSAQTQFIADGTIEYDKSVNIYAIMKKQIDMNPQGSGLMTQIYDQVRKTEPQFKILKSTLSFSKDKTLFEPGAPENSKGIPLITNNPMVEQNNITYTDLSAKKSISQKNIFGQLFLVSDSTRKITWKITGETREIAGYQCRRANGLLLDSIYAVAFYTDDIPVSGGPESFSGLPGMILGVALPHENVTWFATKVNSVAVPSLKAPAKGKAVNNKELKATLESALKNRGSQIQNFLKAFLL